MVWTCTEEAQWVYWAERVKDGGKDEDNREES